jgi:hypothetical protein
MRVTSFQYSKHMYIHTHIQVKYVLEQDDTNDTFKIFNTIGITSLSSSKTP